MKSLYICIFLSLLGFILEIFGSELETTPSQIYAITEAGKAINVFPALDVKLSVNLSELFPIGARLDNSNLEIQFEDVKTGKIQSSHYENPNLFLQLDKEIAKALVTSSGQVLIVVSKPTIFSPPKKDSYRMLAITPLARKNKIVAVRDRMGRMGQEVVGISSEDGSVLWNFEKPQDYDASTGELT